MLDSEVHAAHTTHAASTRRHTGAALVFLRHFGHHGFRGDQERRDRGCILDRHANHLGRVDDALGNQIAVFAGLRVESVGILVIFEDLAEDDGAVFGAFRIKTRRLGTREKNIVPFLCPVASSTNFFSSALRGRCLS
jgi:hypothetical protein